jgi:hypothetical protein
MRVRNKPETINFSFSLNEVDQHNLCNDVNRLEIIKKYIYNKHNITKYDSTSFSLNNIHIEQLSYCYDKEDELNCIVTRVEYYIIIKEDIGLVLKNFLLSNENKRRIFKL